MANENSVRSYRDFDAYSREGQEADLAPRRAGGDPLAELARIMGQDQGYAELLKSVARTRDTMPAEQHDHDAAEPADEPLDIPAMTLRGHGHSDQSPADHSQVDAGEIDWDDLEAELQTYQQAEAGEDHDAGDSADGEDQASDELRGSYDDWDRSAEATGDLERLLADEFNRPATHAASDGQGDRSGGLGYGVAAAAGAVALGGAAALAWRAKSGKAEQTAPSVAADEQAAYRYADEALAHEEAPPRRRRAGMTAIAAVLGLAVLGGGGVLAYRSVSGGGSASGEPRIVRANPEPVRVAVQQAQEAKPVTDRVATGDRMVAREERPVSAREQAAQVQAPPAPSRVIPLIPGPAAAAPAPAAPVGMVTDPGQAPVRTVNAVPVAAPALAATAPARVGEEPRRVRTVQVGPDGNLIAPTPAPRPAQPAAAASAQPLSVVPAAPARSEAPALASAESRAAAAPRPVQTQPIRVARAEPAQEAPRPAAAPPAQRQASAPPLDLGPQRTATVRTAASGGTFVQISSHQSDAEARGAFASAQRRFPMLQGQSPNIRVAEIEGRGTWHRLRVGPFSREEAQNFCQRLKSSGGSCVLN